VNTNTSSSIKLLPPGDWYRLWRDKTPEEIEESNAEAAFQRFLADIYNRYSVAYAHIHAAPPPSPTYPMIIDECYTWEHRQHNNTNAKKKPSLRRRGWK